MSADKKSRLIAGGATPCVIWLTGLSGAGKSTIAALLQGRLCAEGYQSCVLDGDKLRQGLNRDLSFTDADRAENVRRVSELAKLMVDEGLIVLVALISPFRADRQRAQDLMKRGEFLEVFVDTTLEEAERRDAKGLYARARRGQISHFTGISSVYEPPLNPDVHIETSICDPDQAAERILKELARSKFR